ncbi:conserved hypothetical protein [Vibrio nigripulchritudo MADA3029]|uniref:hypothetical protein n=1 Tax=Vibrio TaxID=662 RepID=UPI0003B23AA1|nr:MULTISPECIES: hypothetical protein [Vibrio]ASO31059.1 hypothetical protein CG015_17985 [Vibrio anguillarum]CCN51195.1 conserved hypothetical protein [Vibrio nigripulchritudo MADA3021]CCN57916.1 conserved hypothetical protein [Vibrio nigripulchritudo MADA3029]HDZ9271003.1 hypothetical protein [Vibrio cholerae]
MKDSENIAINLVTQDYIAGSQEYSVSLNVTNISGQPISDLQVFNTLSAGRELSINDDLDATNLTELEDKKRRLIRELEKGVESAYARKRRKKISFSEAIALAIVELVDGYASIFSKKKTQPTTPYWAEEALKIDEWEDVERLEKEVISFESEESFLPKAYSINKDKLKRVMERLEKVQGREFSKGISLPVGSTITFPFSYRAPHLLKSKKMDVSFKATYKLNDDVVHTRTVTSRISILPSAFAVPTGGMIGAAVGYVIKNTLISTSDEVLINWGVLGGSVALGLVISLLASRKPEATKAITVEDLTGGLIIGVLAGLYSESILTKLQTLL